MFPIDFCKAPNWKDAGGYSREKENSEGDAHILTKNNRGMWREEEKGTGCKKAINGYNSNMKNDLVKYLDDTILIYLLF